jgi:hypothetical protein
VAVPAYADAGTRPPTAGEMLPEREPVSAEQDRIIVGEPARQASSGVSYAQTADRPIAAGEAEVEPEPEHVQATPHPANFEPEPRHEEIRAEEPAAAPSPEFEPDAAGAAAPEVIAGSEAAQDRQWVADEIHATAEAEPIEPAAEPVVFAAERPRDNIIAQESVAAPSPEAEPDAAVADAQEVIAEEPVTAPPPEFEPDAAGAEAPGVIAEHEAVLEQQPVVAEEPVTAPPPEFEPDAAVDEAPEVIAESEGTQDQRSVADEIHATVEAEPIELQAAPVVFGPDSPEKDILAEEADARAVEEPPPAEAVAEAPTDEVAVTEEAEETTEEPAVAMRDTIADKQDTLEPAGQLSGPDVPATDEPADEQQPAVAEPALTESEDEPAAEPSELAAKVEEATASTNGHHADELMPDEQRQDAVVSTEGDEEVAERLLTEALGGEPRAGEDEPVIARAQLFERFKMLDVSQPMRDDVSSSNEEERKGRKGKKKAKGKAKASAKRKSRRDSSGDEEDEEETIRVDVSEVAAKTLQVKRWTKQEEPFRGFDSPPGRF